MISPLSAFRCQYPRRALLRPLPHLYLRWLLFPVQDELLDLIPILVRPELHVLVLDGHRSVLALARSPVTPLARLRALADALIDPALAVEAPDGPLTGRGVDAVKLFPGLRAGLPGQPDEGLVEDPLAADFLLLSPGVGGGPDATDEVVPPLLEPHDRPPLA